MAKWMSTVTCATISCQRAQGADERDQITSVVEVSKDGDLTTAGRMKR